MLKLLINTITKLLNIKNLDIECCQSKADRGSNTQIIQSKGSITNRFSSRGISVSSSNRTSNCLLSVIGNNIILDNEVIGKIEDKVINITIEGNVEELNIDACNTLTVKGSVQSLQLTNGDIIVENSVMGDVKNTNGDIIAKEIKGNVKTTNGDIYKN